MKYMKHILLILLLCATAILPAQVLQWGSLQPENRHVLMARSGLDYGLTTGLGYGYQVKLRYPLVLSANYAFPAGKTLLDDYRLQLNAQMSLPITERLRVNGLVAGVLRRYENPNVRMLNWGSDLRIAAGYYRPRWFAAAEFGSDKAIMTHLKHSQVYHNQFPGVQDGWYAPPTGGTVLYGVQAGGTLGRVDLCLRAGKRLQDDFRGRLMLPFYSDLNVTVRF